MLALRSIRKSNKEFEKERLKYNVVNFRNAAKPKSTNDQPSLRWKDVDVNQSNSILKESVENNNGKQQKRGEKKRTQKHHLEEDDQWEIDSGKTKKIF